MDVSKMTKYKVRFLFNAGFCYMVDGQLRESAFCNIKDENERNISWYSHPVYKKIKFFYLDGKNLRLHSSKLYDKRKLKKLANSESFRLQRYAFFDYGYVLELLGGDKSDCKFSGMRGKGASL